MDITEYAPFGCLKYIHVAVDTCSRALFVCPFTTSMTQKSILHRNRAFACLGVPREIKTDNGPNYRSRVFRHFLQMWGVRHTFGIPLNSTKQVIVERAHKTLKAQLICFREGGKRGSPGVLVSEVLVVLNHMSFANPQSVSPIQNHFSSCQLLFGGKALPKVWYRLPENPGWEGPADLLTWGRGYACISTGAGTRWIPAWLVQPEITTNFWERFTNCADSTQVCIARGLLGA